MTQPLVSNDPPIIIIADGALAQRYQQALQFIGVDSVTLAGDHTLSARNTEHSHAWPKLPLIAILRGITVSLVVGYLAQGYGFAPALVYISAVALIGARSYILLVGEAERVG